MTKMTRVLTMMMMMLMMTHAGAKLGDTRAAAVANKSFSFTVFKPKRFNYIYKHRPLFIYWRVEWVWNLVFNPTRECSVEQKFWGYGRKREEAVGSWEGGVGGLRSGRVGNTATGYSRSLPNKCTAFVLTYGRNKINLLFRF